MVIPGALGPPSPSMDDNTAARSKNSASCGGEKPLRGLHMQRLAYFRRQGVCYFDSTSFRVVGNGAGK